VKPRDIYLSVCLSVFICHKYEQYNEKAFNDYYISPGRTVRLAKNTKQRPRRATKTKYFYL